MRGFVSHGSWCFICQARRAGPEQGVSTWSFSRGKHVRWAICRECWRLVLAAVAGAKEAIG